MTRGANWRRILSAGVVWGMTVGLCGAQSIPATRVSVDAAGTQVMGASRQPSASADGRFVAFSSTATTLVTGDTNASADVFVKDRQTGAVTRVSVRTDTSQQTGDSITPDISSDGRFVTFASTAALVADDTNACPGLPTCADIYVHDRTTGATTRVSVATGGAQAGAASALPRISGDGRYVVFESAASTLVAGDTNGVTDVFLHDRQTAATTRVSVATGGAQTDRAATAPSISDDGARIAYLSDATTLVASPDPAPCPPTLAPCTRAFVRDAAGTTARFDVPQASLGYRVSSPVVSGDGAAVGFLVYGWQPNGTSTVAYEAIIVRSPTGDFADRIRPGYTGSPASGPYAVGPSRFRSLALDRRGRTWAACYLGFSAALDTWGVVIEDGVTGLGAVAAGTTDPGGYLAAQPDCDGVGLTDDGTITFLASSGDQIVAGDGNGAMDVFVQNRDQDGDGMPAEWETFFRLSNTDPADAALDPDGDGLTNRQEFDAATHPHGLFRYYLAEGVQNAFFSTDIAIFNPNPSLTPGSSDFATVVASYQTQSGRRSSGPAWGFYDPGNGGALFRGPYPSPTLNEPFSTVIESDRSLAVERTVTWGGAFGEGYGSHAETATTGPSTTAHFAEGATHGAFDLFYLLQNPANVPATATITYLRPAPQPPIVRSYALLPNSRRTIWVDQEAGLEATDVSARIVADQPIFAERAMYLSTPGQPFAGGTASAGITAPAPQWFIAEGATGVFFDLYLLIGNPSPTSANVTVTYLLPGGTSIEKTHQVAAESRLTISVKGEDARLAATAVSASITSTNATPIVVERAMWWPSPSWYEGAVTAATTTAATRWALAGGYIDRARPDTETYLLVANPGATVANVTFDLGVGGQAAGTGIPTSTACRVTVAVPAHGRYTTGLRDVCPFVNYPFSTLRIAGTIESDGPPIVVERSTYWSAGGQFWAAGASTLLTRLP
jgi:Tol biopolymer transport system component